MPGTFDHHLHIVLPGLLRQLAQDLEFGELRSVAGIANGAGPQAVAEREADVVLLENFADVVEALVKKILLLVRRHP